MRAMTIKALTGYKYPDLPMGQNFVLPGIEPKGLHEVMLVNGTGEILFEGTAGDNSRFFAEGQWGPSKLYIDDELKIVIGTGNRTYDAKFTFLVDGGYAVNIRKIEQ